MNTELQKKFDKAQKLTNEIAWIKDELEPIQKQECVSVQLSFSKPTKADKDKFTYYRIELDAIADSASYAQLEELVIAIGQQRIHKKSQELQTALDELQIMTREVAS